MFLIRGVWRRGSVLACVIRHTLWYISSLHFMFPSLLFKDLYIFSNDDFYIQKPNMVLHNCSCAHFVFGVKPVVENRKEANEKQSLLNDFR